MKHTKSLPYLLVLFLLITLSAVGFAEERTRWIYLIIFALSILAFTILSSTKGFLFFLMLAIGMGLYHIGDAVYTKASNANQLEMVGSYLIIFTGVALLWLIFYLIHDTQQEHAQLKQNVEQLKKFEPYEQVFTKTEFLARTTLLYTGMKRRNETGYLVILELNPEKNYIQEALFHQVSFHALRTIRKEYDLVGKLSHKTVVLLLQNTDEKGSDIVLHRLRENIATELRAEAVPYTVKKMILNDTTYTRLMKGEVVL